MNTKISTNRLDSVQWLRALAAVLVLFEHAQIEAEQMSGGVFTRIPFHWGSGVDIFFVISGFIMVYSARDAFGSKWSGLSFIVKRFVRIAPIYYIYTALMIAAAVILPKQLESSNLSAAHIASSFAFIPHADLEGRIRPILQLGWTLNYEMAFYVVFAASMFMPRGKAVKTTIFTIFTACLLGLATSPQNTQLKFWTQPIILEFAFGMVIGTIFLGRESIREVLSWPALTCLIAILAIAPFKLDALQRPLTSGLMGALLLYVFVWMMPAIKNALLARTLTLLGDSSYSLYLCHPFALAVWKLAWPFEHQRQFDGLYVITASIFAIGCAIGSYLLLEKQLLRLGGYVNKRLPGNPPRAAAPVTP